MPSLEKITSDVNGGMQDIMVSQWGYGSPREEAGPLKKWGFSSIY
jgi:hypothetical protein